jgi:hypothetical protein
MYLMSDKSNPFITWNALNQTKTILINASMLIDTSQTQARLQDLEAPVRLVKWDLNIRSSLITSKIKLYIYFII